MPKISAASVQQNREQQRARILQAAERLLVNGTKPTFSQLSKELGLPRPTIYYYFPSVLALEGEIVEACSQRWISAIHGAVDAAARPSERIAQYVRACFDLAASDDVALALSLGSPLVERPTQDRFAELARELGSPVVRALDELGIENPEATSELVRGGVARAVTAVRNGEDRRDYERQAFQLVDALVAAARSKLSGGDHQ